MLQFIYTIYTTIKKYADIPINYTTFPQLVLLNQYKYKNI